MIPVQFEFQRAEPAPLPEKDVVIVHGVLCGAQTCFRLSCHDAIRMMDQLDQAIASAGGSGEQRSTSFSA